MEPIRFLRTSSWILEIGHNLEHDCRKMLTELKWLIRLIRLIKCYENDEKKSDFRNNQSV